jgi:hypothetical protein
MQRVLLDPSKNCRNEFFYLKRLLSSLNWIDKKVPPPWSLSKFFSGSDQTQYERIRAPGFGEVITPSLTGSDRGGGEI